MSKANESNELEKNAQYCLKGTGESEQRKFLNILQGKFNTMKQKQNSNLLPLQE